MRLYLGPVRLRAGQGRARPVASSSGWPGGADVAVIGAGIIGCMTALELARRGLRVVLLEKGVVAGEASGRAQGHVTALWQAPEKLPLIRRARWLWQELSALAPAIFAAVPAVKYGTATEIGAIEDWARAAGVALHRLTRQEIAARLPGARDLPDAACLVPDDGLADPRLAAPALAGAAMAAGAQLYQGCAVRALERQGGRISAVLTERGRIPVQAVVVTAGLWSPGLLRGQGIALPQIEAYGSAMRVRLSGAPPGAGGWAGTSWRQEAGGSFWTVSAQSGIAPLQPFAPRMAGLLRVAMTEMSSHVQVSPSPRAFFDGLRRGAAPPPDRPGLPERLRMAEPPVREAFLRGLLAGLAARFPAMQIHEPAECWSGVLTTTPDNMPILSQVDAVPGLFVASGVYFGLTMGPAAGEMMADLVTGAPPKVDPAVFRLARFDHPGRLRFYP